MMIALLCFPSLHGNNERKKKEKIIIEKGNARASRAYENPRPLSAHRTTTHRKSKIAIQINQATSKLVLFKIQTVVTN